MVVCTCTATSVTQVDGASQRVEKDVSSLKHRISRIRDAVDCVLPLTHANTSKLTTETTEPRHVAGVGVWRRVIDVNETVN